MGTDAAGCASHENHIVILFFTFFIRLVFAIIPRGSQQDNCGVLDVSLLFFFFARLLPFMLSY